MAGEEKVGIAEYKILKSPGKLITLGLGSCVGVAIYNPKLRVGGLSHIMLPNSQEFKKNHQIEKFADLAIPAMVKEIEKLSDKGDLVAKIAGGASMFDLDRGGRETIGNRNIKSVEKILKELNIPILGKDVGGNSGRTMVLDLEAVEVKVRLVMGDYKKL